MSTKSSAQPLIKSPWFFAAIGVVVLVSQVMIWQTTDPSPPVRPALVTAPTAAKPVAPASTPVAATPAQPIPAPAQNPGARRETALDRLKTDKEIPHAPAAVANTWEGQIDHVLRDENSDEQAVSELLQLYPGLPTDGKVEAAEYLVDLVEDQDYALVKALVLDPTAPPEVVEVFLDDLYSRDEQVELPTMVEILKVPNHPAKAEAKETLADYLEQDFGEDTAQWEAAVKKWLEENLETE